MLWTLLLNGLDERAKKALLHLAIDLSHLALQAAVLVGERHSGEQHSNEPADGCADDDSGKCGEKHFFLLC